MKATTWRKSDGFTIVELLVVIVVIGILAAITIISYTGVSSRANVSTLQSDLDNASKQLKLYNVSYSAYPNLDLNNCPSTPVVDNNYCLKTSGGSYLYQTDDSTNPSTFCITETKNGTSYFINQNTQPTAGSCSVTNLDTNPGFESATNFLDSGSNSGNVTGLTHSNQDSTHVLKGTYAAMAESNAATGQYYLINNSPFVPTIGDTYYFSAYVYIPVGSTITGVLIGIRDFSTYTFLTPWVESNVTPGSWTRISCSYTATSANTSWRLSVSDPSGVTAGSPQFYWVDDAMIIQSNSLTSYADGGSSGWTWNGTPNSSTSTGPES
jgi:general secretion pathway protein G